MTEDCFIYILWLIVHRNIKSSLLQCMCWIHYYSFTVIRAAFQLWSYPRSLWKRRECQGMCVRTNLARANHITCNTAWGSPTHPPRAKIYLNFHPSTFFPSKTLSASNHHHQVKWLPSHLLRWLLRLRAKFCLCFCGFSLGIQSFDFDCRFEDIVITTS